MSSIEEGKSIKFTSIVKQGGCDGKGDKQREDDGGGEKAHIFVRLVGVNSVWYAFVKMTAIL
jgi:hypothetical protein